MGVASKMICDSDPFVAFLKGQKKSHRRWPFAYGHCAAGRRKKYGEIPGISLRCTRTVHVCVCVCTVSMICVCVYRFCKPIVQSDCKKTFTVFQEATASPGISYTKGKTGLPLPAHNDLAGLSQQHKL